jgi:hypothetical protein
MAWTSLPGRNGGFDCFEEADELWMPVTLHAAADYLAVRIRSGRQTVWWCHAACRQLGYGAAAAFLHGQTRLAAVERLHLALFIDGQHDGMG